MDALAAAAARFLEQLTHTGPVGAVIASIIIAGGLVVIGVAGSLNLWADSRGRSQSVEMTDRTLKLIDTLMASETALRLRIDEMARQRDHDLDEIDELRSDIALLRNQRRRLIEYLRALRSGHPVADLRAVEVTP